MGTGPARLTAVRITGGHKRFRGQHVLRGIDLHIDDGEFVAILGRSGSGKSTLLRVLAGLDQLTEGTLEWADGAGGSRPHTGVVFQQPLLMPWLTVRENIEFGGRFGAHKRRFDTDHAHSLLDRFGLGPLADRRPDQLSGGQAQRVAIIRAVAVRPQLLLLDEPFSALDPAIRGDLQEWLAELAGELDVTVVLVTHDVDEAIELADRVVLLGEAGVIRREWRLETADRHGDGAAALRNEILAHYRTRVGETV